MAGSELERFGTCSEAGLLATYMTAYHADAGD